MVIEKRGPTDRDVLMSVLATRPPVSAFGGSGGYGFSWALAMQVAGWIIQGIGLGKSVYDATREAGENIPAGETLDEQDVDAVATTLQEKFPATTKESWAALIREQMAGKVQPTTPAVQECAAGFYRDPVTGACVEIKKEFEMPAWGWAAVAIGGVLLLPSIMSMLKVGR